MRFKLYDKSNFINIIMRMHSAVKEVPMSKKVLICLAVPGRAVTLIFYAMNFCVEHRMPGTKQKRSGSLRKGGSLFRLLLLQHPRRSLRPQG